MDGMEDTLQGGRDEMRGFGGRAGFTIFCEDFTGSFLSVVVGLGCLVWFCVAFFAGEMTPACSSCFTLFCFRIPRELTDHAPCSLGNAGKKKPLVRTMKRINQTNSTKIFAEECVKDESHARKRRIGADPSWNQWPAGDL